MEEEKRLRGEQAKLVLERERQKEMDILQSQKKTLADRIAVLHSGKSKIQQSLDGLGDLEAREAELRRQDRDLDALGSELNNALADLRGA